MPKTATQNILPIETIRDDVLILKGGGMRAVLLASSLNMALKSSDEQKALYFQFQQFLNSLDFSMQILMQSRKVNIKEYIRGLEEMMTAQTNDLLKLQIQDYISFISSLTEGTNIMTKKFFVVVPFNPYETKVKEGGVERLKKVFQTKRIAESSKEEFYHYKNQLWQRVEYVMQGLMSFGVISQHLSTRALIELFWGAYNIDEMEEGFYPQIPEDISVFANNRGEPSGFGPLKIKDL